MLQTRTLRPRGAMHICYRHQIRQLNATLLSRALHKLPLGKHQGF